MDEEKTDQELLSQATDKSFEKLSAEEKTVPPEAQPPASPAIEAGKGDKSSGKGELDEKTLTDIKEGKLIPKHRFDEVSAKVKLYESFGTPEEIEEKIKAALSQPPKLVKPTSEDQLNEEDKQMKDYLEKIHPELKKLPQLLQQMVDMMKISEQERTVSLTQKKAEWDKNTEKGTDAIKKMAKDAGLDSENEELMEDVVDAVVRRLHKDKTLSDKFYLERDIEVLKPIFDQYFKNVFSETRRKAASDLLADKRREKNLNRAPVKGTPPPEPAEKEPQTLEEASARAVEKAYS